MSRISPSTFKPEKNYVAVRMQQGVPLVDADWNEMNDIIRHEIYDGLKHIWPNGDYISGDSLKVSYNETKHRIEVDPGSVIIKGLPVHLREKVYKNQDLSVLTSYLVYLDIWEQEVGGDADPELRNSLIGVETCVRLKRKIEVKVIKGTLPQPWRRPDLPREPEGHIYVPMAFLMKKLVMSNLSHQLSLQIEDVRPGIQEISIFPAFFGIDDIHNSWTLSSISWRVNDYTVPWDGVRPSSTYPCKYFAVKNPHSEAHGIIPLKLPQSARILGLKIQGFTQGNVTISIYRSNSKDIGNLENGGGDELFDESIVLKPPPDESSLVFPPVEYYTKQEEESVIDNNKYLYSLCASASGDNPYVAEIHGISIIYRP